MSGVNLIDFTMPSAVPAPAGGETKTRNVGGMKLILPKKGEQKGKQARTPAEEQTKRDWWKALLPLLGILIVIKLATWYARRYGK